MCNMLISAFSQIFTCMGIPGYRQTACHGAYSLLMADMRKAGNLQTEFVVIFYLKCGNFGAKQRTNRGSFEEMSAMCVNR